MTTPASKPERRGVARPRRAAGAATAPSPAVAPVAAADRIGVTHLTAEYWPFARTGGLGEAVSGLATVQAAAGHPTTVIMPLYQLVRETTPSLERTGGGQALVVTLGGHTEHAWLYEARAPGPGPRVYFIEHPDFFDRAGIYGDSGSDYPDNAQRFAFFCLAALTALPEIAPQTQLLHAHDWHTALAPVYLRTAFRGQPFHDRLATVLSVHNAGFQGHFPTETVAQLGLAPELYNPDVFEWYGRMNWLKGG
ncbi:MAG TPA: glycogen/starch synthase, partial [Gemmatimonadales bacterium]|nr:glycogen/starch synthase [Gemmatimonadales bacterium]